MKKVKWYRNPEMIVALSALFIGLLTAVISVYSASVDREYARASVWPKLELFRSYSGEEFSYGVANKGTGPAIIQYAKVSVGSKPIKRWSEVSEFSNITQSHINSITVPSGQTVTPLHYRGELISDILEFDEKINIELCYCSIYQECWIVNRSNETQQVKQCMVSSEEAFVQ
ncbi:hypothetical protein CWE13_09480 [Aliidiomarina shirensis]|uniref:Uncharacterized protein n=1 Tax=Aliidiomarina shirensis TaxID=1048642 RepID=A0A432WQM1_9GAMM|nr:hypothetical protein [Aliidiomarina shirensis]RUO36096.1 hypothetical protein CWE13_09480 [Aliidiomarina shirensis]